MSGQDNSDSLIQLEFKIDRLVAGVDVLKDKQDLMAEDISKIKEAVYNPDEGLYARIRALESWKSLSAKLIWTLFTTTIGLVSAFVVKNL